MIQSIRALMPSLTQMVLGVVLFKLGQGVLSVISGARAARRINVQLAVLLTYISMKDPMMLVILAKTSIDVVGDKVVKK